MVFKAWIFHVLIQNESYWNMQNFNNTMAPAPWHF